MYKIKQKPEDFIVEEITNVKPKDSGRYIYYKMKKRNYTVIRALGQIAGRLNIPLRRIGFAGTKDKIALSTQYISFDYVAREKIDRLKLEDITLEFYGYGDNPISLGDLIENHFIIMVDDADKEPKVLKRFVNYFGQQRFSKNNVDVGKAILKKDFKRAVNLIVEVDNDFRERSEEYLKDQLNDYIGLLRTIPKKILLLYVHSYQSYVWNESVKQLPDKDKVPIVGFDTKLDGWDIIKSIIEKDGIILRDFIIRSIPELTSEGDIREMFAEVHDMKIEKIEDRYRLEFFLPKGSYATVFLEQIFA